VSAHVVGPARRWSSIASSRRATFTIATTHHSECVSIGSSMRRATFSCSAERATRAREAAMCAQCTLEGEAMSRFEMRLRHVQEVSVPYVKLPDEGDVPSHRPQGGIYGLYDRRPAKYFDDRSHAERVNQQNDQRNPNPSEHGSGVLAIRLVHGKDVGSLVFPVKEEDEAMSRFKGSIDTPEEKVPVQKCGNGRDAVRCCYQGAVQENYGSGDPEEFDHGTDAEDVNQQRRQAVPDHPLQNARGLGLRLVHTKDVGCLVFLVKEEDD
jgi:hypothetical protein